MLNSKISVQIKSLIESVLENTEKNFKPLPVRFEPQTSALTTTPWKLNENERLIFLYF